MVHETAKGVETFSCFWPRTCGTLSEKTTRTLVKRTRGIQTLQCRASATLQRKLGIESLPRILKRPHNLLEVAYLEALLQQKRRELVVRLRREPQSEIRVRLERA